MYITHITSEKKERKKTEYTTLGKDMLMCETVYALLPT